MPTSRDMVVAEAMSWRGTPFRHAAGIKGAGVDCGMLILRVFQAVGLLPPWEPPPYAAQWFLHRTEDHFTPVLREHGVEVSGPPLPGDVACFQMGRAPYGHTGIVVDWPRLVHAAPGCGVVLARGDSGPLAGRYRAAWRPRGLVDG